jgi:hypothetical protein
LVHTYCKIFEKNSICFGLHKNMHTTHKWRCFHIWTPTYCQQTSYLCIPRGWFQHKMRYRLYWKYIGRLLIDIEPWKVFKNIMNENILKIQITQEYYIEKILKHLTMPFD